MHKKFSYSYYLPVTHSNLNGNLNSKLVEVNRFWFEELTEKDWWKKDETVDFEIKSRFGTLHQKAKAGELASVRNTPEARLAEIIVLDQFSRNIYRDQPEAFACDKVALSLAQEAVANGDDQNLEKRQRQFIYMPYMHSESLAIHDQAVELFTALGFASSLKFEHAHRNIIARFGRYPHRNKILGRESTPEELAFLEQPGSSF